MRFHFRVILDLNNANRDWLARLRVNKERTSDDVAFVREGVRWVP
jgi:hypothetical protein